MTCNPDRRSWRRLAVALFGLGGAATLTWIAPAQADAGAARSALRRSLTALERGNATAARTHAQQAVTDDPQWGLAHAVLARAHLALGEGLAAEAELDRAHAAGFDARRSHQMRAHAKLLQGDAASALAEAERTTPAYRAYGLRMRGLALAEQGDLIAAFRALDTAVAERPGDAAAWADLGRTRLRAGDMVGAINASVQAVRANPGSPDALLLRAQMVRVQYGPLASLRWFEAALSWDADRHDTLVEYAATLGDTGRTRDMLGAVRRAMAARPGSPQAYYLQAVLAARAGGYELARGILLRAGDGGAGVPGALLLGGTLDIESGAYAQGAIKLRQLLGQQPTNLVARRLLARALLGSDAAAEAVEILQPLVQRADADPYALTLMARAQERLGDRVRAGRYLDRARVPGNGMADAFSPDDALRQLATAFEGSGGDPEAGIPYVRALLYAGDEAAAIATATRIARANPGAPAAQLVLGDALLAANRVNDGIAAYRRAAATRFDEPTALRLVDALDRRGDRRSASATLGLFLAQNPDSIPAARLAAGWQLAAGQYDLAIDQLESLRFLLGDRDAALLADLATAYAGSGDATRATRYGAAAYALAPANPAVAEAYGWALFRDGNPGAAAALLGKAVAIAPGHAPSRWRLAQVQAGLGESMAARGNVRMALADPRFADRRAAERLLAVLG